MVAIKRMDTQEAYREKAARSEIEALQELASHCQHPHVVNLIEVIPGKKHVNLVMEYCGGGDLKQYIVKNVLSERDVRYFFAQIVCGLKFLAEHNIVHRDLKPQNLLLAEHDPPILKIADFGFAKQLSATSLAQTHCGSPLYMAPEVFTEDSYDSAADVWSLGAIAFEMMYRRPPIEARNHAELARTLQALKRSAIRLPIEPQVSSEFSNLLLGMLTHDRHARVTLQQILTIPFVTKGIREFQRLLYPTTSVASPVMQTTIEASANTEQDHPAQTASVVASSYVHVRADGLDAESQEHEIEMPWKELSHAQDPCAIRTFNNVQSDLKLSRFMHVLAKREGILSNGSLHASVYDVHARAAAPTCSCAARGWEHGARLQIAQDNVKTNSALEMCNVPLFYHTSADAQKKSVEALGLAYVWQEIHVGAMINMSKLMCTRGMYVERLATHFADSVRSFERQADALCLCTLAAQLYSRAMDSLQSARERVVTMQCELARHRGNMVRRNYDRKWADLMWLLTQCEPGSPSVTWICKALDTLSVFARQVLQRLGDEHERARGGRRARHTSSILYEAALEKAKTSGLAENDALVHDRLERERANGILKQYEEALALVEALAMLEYACPSVVEQLQTFADLVSARIVAVKKLCSAPR